MYDESARLTGLAKEESDEEKKAELAARATALLRHAVRSESEPRINALLHNTEMDLLITPEDLDADPWALNCQNGTLDLRTLRQNP